MELGLFFDSIVTIYLSVFYVCVFVCFVIFEVFLRLGDRCNKFEVSDKRCKKDKV